MMSLVTNRNLKVGVIVLLVLSLAFVSFIPLAEAHYNDTHGTIEFSNDDFVSNDISDEDYELYREIGESDLQQTTVVHKNGLLKPGYNNSGQAGVSKEAYQKYREILRILNAEIRNGNILIGDNLEIVEVLGYSVTDDAEVIIDDSISIQTHRFYTISNNAINKLNKLVSQGLSLVAAVALVFPKVGIGIVVVGIGLAALNLCNWYDKGVVVFHVRTWQWSCYPRT